MDVRRGFIINNLQSNREKDFNARHLREQVNPKGLPILFELYHLKSILLSYVIKLYCLTSCTVTLRHSEFFEKRDKTVFEIREFIDFIISIFITGFEEMCEDHF